MGIHRAISIAAAPDEPELRRLYGAAVAHGATNTGCTAEEERSYGVLRLLTPALLRLPDLAVCTHVLQLVDEAAGDPLVARTLSEVAGGALRLAHRALEVHGRDVGYETGAWIDHALLRAGVALDRQRSGEDDEALVALDEARSATSAPTRATAATAATADNRMLVPEEVADGLGHLLAIYLIGSAAGDDGSQPAGAGGLRPVPLT